MQFLIKEALVDNFALDELLLHINVLELKTVLFGLNPKTAGGWVDLTPSPPLCGFSKNVSSKERVKLWVFVTFNIIIRHIFPENFIEIPQVVQKLWRISLSILAIFIDFHQFFGFFDISLLQRN